MGVGIVQLPNRKSETPRRKRSSDTLHEAHFLDPILSVLVFLEPHFTGRGYARLVWSMRWADGIDRVAGPVS